jgi:hypothetical protein
MPPGLSTSDFYYILPELVLTAGALILLVVDVLMPRKGILIFKSGAGDEVVRLDDE